MKEHFTREMDHLKDMVNQLANEAEYALEKVVQAVASLDCDAARMVIDGDYAIDCREIKIEEECLKILALYQPVASDLRTVITLLKVNNEIERVGDFAVNIARRVLHMAPLGEDINERFDFSEMADRARKMLRSALQSMNDSDTLLAFETIRRDSEVDDMNRANIRKAEELIARNPNMGSYYIDCVGISRVLERTADIATNICEDVIYLETGKIVRHSHDI